MTTRWRGGRGQINIDEHESAECQIDGCTRCRRLVAKLARVSFVVCSRAAETTPIGIASHPPILDEKLDGMNLVARHSPVLVGGT